MLLCLRKQARKSPTTEMSYYVVCALLGFSVQKSGLKIWNLITVEMKEQSHLCCTGSLGIWYEMSSIKQIWHKASFISTTNLTLLWISFQRRSNCWTAYRKLY